MYGAASADVRLREARHEAPPYGGPTIFSAACADALLGLPEDASDGDITRAVADSLKDWARRHPEVAYGRDFERWASGQKEALSSRGAMGVIGWMGSAGWLYGTLERTQDVARAAAQAVSAEPQALRAAQCVAAMLFLGRTGRSKKELLEFSRRVFGYEVNAYVDAICDGRAIHVDALDMPYMALSLYSVAKPGMGTEDLDPFTAAAVGSILEADGTLPEAMRKEAVSKLPQDVLEVLDQVGIPREGSTVLGHARVDLREGADSHRPETREDAEDPGRHGEAIEEAIGLMYSGGRSPYTGQPSEAGVQALTEALVDAVRDDGQVVVAWDVAFPEPDKLAESVRYFFVHGLVQYYEGVRATASAVTRTTAVRVGQRPAVAVFTGSNIPKNANTLRVSAKQALLAALDTSGADGIILNPFGQSAPLGRDAVLAILAAAGVDTRDEWLAPEDHGPHGDLDDMDPRAYAGNEMIQDAAVASPDADDIRYGVLSQTLRTSGLTPVDRALIRRAAMGGKLILGYKVSAIPGPEMERLARRTLVDGEAGTMTLWTQVLPVAVADDEGDPSLVAFTKPDEARNWQDKYRFAEMDIRQVLGIVERMDEGVGLCLDPFGVDMRLKRPEVLSILEKIRTGQVE